EVHCSRERSRAAWRIIDTYLHPFLHRAKYQLPTHCRLHPSNDIFREQEEHKIHFDINEWRCGYCKKSFVKEEYLEQHFDNRHYNLLNVSHGKCLADLCGALHCDYVLNSQSRKTKCNPLAASRNLHLCEEIADNCFPLSTRSPVATHLHEFFLRQFCDAHNCSRKRKYFPRGGQKGSNILYVATSIMILILLPVFYTLVYLYKR
ncbi:hypothetical protein M569_09480, partial [Genlisea aurea]